MGAQPKAAKKGFQGFPLKNFPKLVRKSCILGIFGIVSHEIMLSRFVRGGPAMHPQLYTSARYSMAQVSGASEYGVHVPKN